MIVKEVGIVVILAVDCTFDRRCVCPDDQDIVDLVQLTVGLPLGVDWVPLDSELEQAACVRDWTDIVIQVSHAFALFCVNGQPSEIWSFAFDTNEGYSWVDYFYCMGLAGHTYQIKRLWL